MFYLQPQKLKPPEEQQARFGIILWSISVKPIASLPSHFPTQWGELTFCLLAKHFAFMGINQTCLRERAS